VVLLTSCGDGRLRTASGWLEPATDRLDFGATTLGVPVDRDVDLAQRGLLAAVVASVRLDPGNGYSVLAPPGSVPPGGHARMRVTFLPLSPGDARTSLSLGQEDRPGLVFRLQGRGVDARAVPQNALDFGRPALGARRTRVLQLRNDAETPVPIALRAVGPDASEFEFAPVHEVGPFDEAAIVVTYEPAGRAGPRDAALELTACPLCSPERLPIAADAVLQALVVTPNPIHLGNVPLDAHNRVTIGVTNETDEAVQVDAMALAAADAGFGIDPPPMPAQVAPLATREAMVRFSPVHIGAATAVLQVRSASVPAGILSVDVDANGGGAQLVVTPARLDFPPTPAGTRRVLRLTLENGGDAAAPPLHLGAIVSDGAAFALRDVLPAGTALAAGDRATLTVEYRPGAPGLDGGTLRIASDDAISPLVEVPLAGVATQPALCLLQTDPPSLDFGGVRAGKGAVLAVKITNVGTEPCSLWDGRVEGDGAFALAKPRPAVWLEPGAWQPVTIAFRPPSSGRFAASLVFDTNAAPPRLEVALAGGSDGACLVPEPSYLDFGGNRTDCAPPEQIAAWRNRCRNPVVADGPWLGDGTDPGTFSIVGSTPMPASVPPGALVQVQVRFKPVREGFAYQALFVRGDDAPLPVLLPLQGETLRAAAHDETFVQPAAGRLDVLVVVDNTASTRDKRPALQSAMRAMLDHADALGADYHVGVTTTGIAPDASGPEPCGGGVDGGEAGRLFPVDHARPRVVEPSMSDRTSVLAANLDVGGCQSVKQGLEAVRRALLPPLVDNADHPRTPEPLDGNLGLLRDDARLAILVWSDDDDQSPGPLASRLDGLARLLPEKAKSFNAVVAPASGCPGMSNPGTHYLAAVQRIGGFAASVCDPDWSAPAMALVDDAMAPHVRFPLAAAADPATLGVLVDGRPAAGWSYDPVRPAIVFAVPPDAGARVRAVYSEACPVP